MKAWFGMAKTRRDVTVDVARLYSDDLSREDERLIRERQKADKVYLQEFMDTAELLSDMKGLAESQAVQSVLNEQPKSLLARRRAWVGAVAAGVLLAVAITFIDDFAATDRFDAVEDVSRYVTRVGEQKAFELEDGSVINLNTSSEVLVSFSEAGRQLFLNRGEAYFEVAKDPVRPFTVEIGDHAVTAIGTAFNIRKEKKAFSLGVVEGVVVLHGDHEKVDVSAKVLPETEKGTIGLHASSQYRIEAGWVAEFDGQERLSGRFSDDVSRIQQWRSGLLSFEGEPLYIMVKELNRYSAKKILIEDMSIMDLKIYAVVKVDRIHSALNGLERSHSIKIENHLDRIVIVGDSD